MIQPPDQNLAGLDSIQINILEVHDQALQIKPYLLKKPPQANMVLIQVHAAGVNRPDLLQRQGLYSPPNDASPTLGLEVSGRIVGGDLQGLFKEGDRVCALTHGGGYATHAWVDVRHCLPIPHWMSDELAASLPEAFFTVWFNLVMRTPDIADVKHVLVHNGGSGIGAATLFLAKNILDICVTTTFRDPSKKDFCLAMGADHVWGIDTDWKTACHEQFLKDGLQIDTIVDMMGAEFLDDHLQLIKKNGQIIWLAYLTGATCSLSIAKLMAKNVYLTGSMLRGQTPEVKAEISKNLSLNVWPLLNQDMFLAWKIKTYPWQQAEKAHQQMLDRKHLGKLILKISD